MVFLVDDVAYTIFIYPWQFLFERIRDYAYNEMYDVDEIKNALKENRLLYEFEEIDEEEYKKTEEKLRHDLKVAQRVQSVTNIQTL